MSRFCATRLYSTCPLPRSGGGVPQLLLRDGGGRSVSPSNRPRFARTVHISGSYPFSPPACWGRCRIFEAEGAGRSPLGVLRRGFVRHASSQRVLSHEVGEVSRSYCCGTEGAPRRAGQRGQGCCQLPPQSGAAGQLPRQRESTRERWSSTPNRFALSRSVTPLGNGPAA